MKRRIKNQSIKIEETIERQRGKEISSDGEIVGDTIVIVVNGIQTIVSINGLRSAKKRDASL